MGSGHLEEANDRELTQGILREAERRIQARSADSSPESTLTPAQRERAVKLNRGVFWLARHWVALFNAAILLYLAGAILAPVLMHLGLPRFGAALYAFYGPFCHQYPFRSWFLFGDSFARPLHEPLSLVALNRLGSVMGNPETGYKMALCQRDIAIYGIMLLTGIIYGTARRFWRIKPLPFWLYFAFSIMPMMLDGGIQWMSYALWQFVPGLLDQPFETIPALRALTGGLFGFGVIAVGYPYLGEYFDDVIATLQRKYGWTG